MTKNNNLIPYAAGAIMIMLFGAGLWSMNSDRAAKKNMVPMKKADALINQKQIKTGSARLALAAPQVALKVGVPASILVIADSKGAAITDYDVLIAIDSSAFKLGDVTSQLPNYTTVPYEDTETSVLSITGFKSIGSNISARLAGTAVAAITVTPLRAGTHKFSTLESARQSTTKFIDEKSKILFPEVSSLDVTVQ